MATANSESLSNSNTEFFLHEEAESELTLSVPHSNRVEYCNISANITARSLTSFLQTLLQVYKPPANENCILTLAVEAAFNESKSALVEEFLQNILCLFEVCFSQAGAEKHSQKYAISLEKAFAEKRRSSFHHCAIKWSWERLFTNTASQSSEYNQASEQLLQQILQYFWSSSSNSCITVESPEEEGEESTEDPAACDESDFDNIKDHAGWVVKRARETLMKGDNKIPAKESVTESTLVYGDKAGALEIISALGKDVKQADGKFRFVVHEHVVPFFLFLHNLVEKLINPNNVVLQKGNILIDCLDKMARHKELREKWDHLTSKSDETSVIVLQRIATFFVKSKQQILREKRGLKPNKSSMAVRQQLRQSNNKATSSRSSKEKNTVNEEVNKLRSGDLHLLALINF
ncbi:Hypothetical predicted protein [Paramuricea clavata]|uniref:Uncharacterized protein n=1 Tax=Paramuricea clavata TaxID=317549 RepID=A0A7D9HI19_PARCT|nr:Hypothetical predicted protein [Paramuricea clavata]